MHTETPLIPRRRRAGSRSTPRQTVPVLPCRTLTRHILLGKDAPPRGRPPWAQQKPILASEDPRRPTVPLPGWTVDSCQRWPRAGTDAQEGRNFWGWRREAVEASASASLARQQPYPWGTSPSPPALCPMPFCTDAFVLCRNQNKVGRT